MRRGLIIISIALCTFFYSIEAQERGHIYDSVTAYLDALSAECVDSIIVDIDRLVSASGDVKSRSLVAGIAFDYFSSSPVMGHENVAVHIADRYFLSKELEWSDAATYPMLFTYAETNRQSLIGRRAPSLEMERMDGGRFSLSECKGRYKLLFFYDDRCVSCRKEVPLLASLLKQYHGAPLTVLAVYTQSSREDWESYVASTFGDIHNDAVSVVHLWDPEAESGYHIKYGVIKTPSMLLLDEQDIIIGRKLDCKALSQLLGLKNDAIYDYRRLLDNIFASAGTADSLFVSDVASAFHRKCGADSSLFREVFYELYNYLAFSSDYRMQKAAVDLAHQYVLEMPERWSPHYVASIKEAVQLFALNPLGARATDLVLRDRRGKERSLLTRGGKYTLVLFHLIQCDDCRRELDALRAAYPALKRKGVKVVCVYTGHDVALWRDFVDTNERKWLYLYDENGTSSMHQLYDLQYVPKLYLLDRKKIIIAKDIDINTLTGLTL